MTKQMPSFVLLFKYLHHMDVNSENFNWKNQFAFAQNYCKVFFFHFTLVCIALLCTHSYTLYRCMYTIRLSSFFFFKYTLRCLYVSVCVCGTQIWPQGKIVRSFSCQNMNFVWIFFFGLFVHHAQRKENIYTKNNSQFSITCCCFAFFTILIISKVEFFFLCWLLLLLFLRSYTSHTESINTHTRHICVCTHTNKLIHII